MTDVEPKSLILSIVRISSRPLTLSAYIFPILNHFRQDTFRFQSWVILLGQLIFVYLGISFYRSIVPVCIAALHAVSGLLASYLYGPPKNVFGETNI